VFDVFSWTDVDHIQVLSGIANFGDRMGDEYLYFNAFQSSSSPRLSGEHILVADFDMVVKT